MVPTKDSDRGPELRRVRGVIERLVRDGTAIARSDGTLHSLFPWCTEVPAMIPELRLYRTTPANRGKDKEPTSGLEPLSCLRFTVCQPPGSFCRAYAIDSSKPSRLPSAHAASHLVSDNCGRASAR